MGFGQYNLNRIQSLQPTIQPLAQALIQRAAERGIEIEIVQGYRSPEQQDALLTSGKGVTNAPGLLSYHNYGLAFDVVPKDYKELPNWNPTGLHWVTLGQIGEALGLEWGGRWSNPDRPHFQIPSAAAPIRELKAYWEKFKKIMPVEIAPAAGAAGIIVVLALAWFFIVKPALEDRGII